MKLMCFIGCEVIANTSRACDEGALDPFEGEMRCSLSKGTPLMANVQEGALVGAELQLRTD